VILNLTYASKALFGMQKNAWLPVTFVRQYKIGDEQGKDFHIG
jgi:hypothetical protein